jgi:hypothetical protein
VQGLVVAALVPVEQPQGAAQIRFLTQHDAERPEGGQPTATGEQQTEVLASGPVGRQLEERGHVAGRDPLLRGGEVGDVEPHARHQPDRVEAEGPGEVEIAVERGGADAGTHQRSPPDGVRTG